MGNREDALKEMARRELARRSGGAQQAPRAAKVGVGEDMMRSGATGLRQGVESGLGSLSDAAHMNASGEGLLPKLLSIANPIGMIASGLPTTDQIHNVTKKVMGDNYEPQTVPGEYARTVGQFAPAAVMPGGVAQRAKQVLMPALLSETAGQVTKGTAAEPYARMAGGLAGGGLVAGNPAKQLTKMAAKGAPTDIALKTETDNLYGALRSAGIRYDANEFTKMATDLPTVLHKANVRPVGKLKEAFDWADEVQKLSGKSPDFDDINSLRTAVGEAARDAYRSPDGKSLGRAIDIVKDQIDDFERGAPLVTSTPMPKAHLDAIRSKARETALKTIKQRALDDVATNADTYQSGREAGVRNGIGNLLRSARGKQLFNEEERAALLGVAHGGKALRTLSRFGLDIRKFSGNATFLPTAGAAAAGAGLGLPVAGGLLAAGTVAKTISPMLTERAFKQAAGAIRSGKLRGPGSAANLRALEQARRLRILAAGGQGIQSAGAPIK